MSKSRLENYQHPDKFGQWLGYKVEKLDRENFISYLSLKLRDDHLSPAGRVHGGVVSALFDHAAGAAVFITLKPKDFCSTVELKVNYLRPLEIDDEVMVEMKVVFRGKRLAVLHGFLYKNGEKEPAGMATATYNIVSPD